MLEELMLSLYGARANYKGLDVLKYILLNNKKFYNFIIENIKNGKVMPFGDLEFSKIERQNIRAIDNFLTVFKEGLNLGSCTITSKQLSYSYDGCDLVSGTMDLLIGTINSEHGEHSWMEYDEYIYDTTLMLKINKSLAKEIGYNEETRIKSYQLNSNPTYQSTKDYTNDNQIKSF